MGRYREIYHGFLPGRYSIYRAEFRAVVQCGDGGGGRMGAVEEVWRGLEEII